MNYRQILTGKMKITPLGVIQKAVFYMGIYILDRLILSLIFLNSVLLATNGATLGACIALSNRVSTWLGVVRG